MHGSRFRGDMDNNDGGHAAGRQSECKGRESGRCVTLRSVAGGASRCAVSLGVRHAVLICGSARPAGGERAGGAIPHHGRFQTNILGAGARMNEPTSCRLHPSHCSRRLGWAVSTCRGGHRGLVARERGEMARRARRRKMGVPVHPSWTRRSTRPYARLDMRRGGHGCVRFDASSDASKQRSGFTATLPKEIRFNALNPRPLHCP